MASPLKIAIVGAGPAGLTLARLLHVSTAKIDLTVYELDASPTSREDQGGTLDLHDDTGLAAIRKCELWDSFRKYARYEGQEFIFCDKNRTELVHAGGGEKGNKSDRPEIDRHRLREILLESVPEECVRWGWRLREVTEDGMLRFDGRERLGGPFDLVVGGDGAWSKVRGILNEIKPAYSGVSGYEMEIIDPQRTCPHVDKMVGKGMFFGSSDRKMLNGQRLGNNNIKVRSWFRCPEGEAKEILDQCGREGAIKKVLAWYADWAPEMTELLRHGDLGHLRQWTLYQLPVGHKWEHKPGFTLLGDAASLATPFSGEGVNKAMKDSLELAEQIERSQDPSSKLSLDQAVLLYERSMFPRGEKLQATTISNKDVMFGSEAPIGLFTHMMKAKARSSSSIFMKILGTTPVLAAVYSYFWVRKQVGWAVRWLWRRT